jgi:integrase
MKGHIRERSPGHWAIILDAKDPITGKRKRRWYSFPGTKREAQIECAKLIAEQQNGAAIEPNKVTLGQFLDRFETDWVATHVTQYSGERYGYAFNHVRRHLGERRLQKLRPTDLATFYATLAREGSAPRTIRLTHTVLHRALGQAKIWGVIRDNPADLAKPPKLPDRETPMLQPDQAAALLECLRGSPLYLLASFALGSGMRRNEMLGLRWQDVDLDRGRLTIEQSLEQTTAYGIRVKGPKNAARAPDDLPAGASCDRAAAALA